MAIWTSWGKGTSLTLAHGVDSVRRVEALEGNGMLEGIGEGVMEGVTHGVGVAEDWRFVSDQHSSPEGFTHALILD